MLNATVGQHGHFVTAKGDQYHACVIEVTGEFVTCRVTFPENGCTVYSFQRSDGYRSIGREFGRLVLPRVKEMA